MARDSMGSGSPLLAHLVDSSLVDYSVHLTYLALRTAEPALFPSRKKIASSALGFLVSLLDPLIEEEDQQIAFLQRYEAALEEPNLGARFLVQPRELNGPLIADSESSEGYPANPSTPSPSPGPTQPSHPVFSVFDILLLIFSKFSLISRSARRDLRKASLTCRAFHEAAQIRLWRRPPDLRSIESQVYFAFSLTLSQARGFSFGIHVHNLRISARDGWNLRLMQKIVSLTPNVVDLELEWQSIDAAADKTFTSNSRIINSLLIGFRNLVQLSLTQGNTQSPLSQNELDPETRRMLRRLAGVRLSGFEWYWPWIENGTCSNLTSLEVGAGEGIQGYQIVAAVKNIPLLTTLRIGFGLREEELQEIVAGKPRLERFKLVHIRRGTSAEFVINVVALLSGLRHLKELHLSFLTGLSRLDDLIASKAPIEVLSIKLKLQIPTESLAAFVYSKRRTLRHVHLLFQLGLNRVVSVTPTDTFIKAFTSVPYLETLIIQFHWSNKVAPTILDALFSLPHLLFTDNLRDLIWGNRKGGSDLEEKYGSRFLEDKKYLEDFLD